VVINHKNSEDWTSEAIADFWNWKSQNPGSHKEYFTAMIGNGLVNLLRSKHMIKGRVLDYGCGAGHLLSIMLKEPGGEFFGLDFSPDSIEMTRNKCGNNPKLKELLLVKTLPVSFSDNMFDTITFIETIEHLQNNMLENTLAEIYRILKPGGKVFITTPFDEDLEKHLAFCPFCKAEFHQMQHMQSFTVNGIKMLLEKHQFVIEYCKNIDLDKYQIGIFKYKIKKILHKCATLLGLKEPISNLTPNLLIIMSK
jgi:ubiquinone/menaquinone biosynthesis C-methylase UbiE